jgi:putative ABC transport system ATP-binding protein
MARGVMELLEEVNRQGTTIVMVTHDPELAARAQRNVHVIDGQVTDFDEAPRLRDPDAPNASPRSDAESLAAAN